MFSQEFPQDSLPPSPPMSFGTQSRCGVIDLIIKEDVDVARSNFSSDPIENSIQVRGADSCTLRSPHVRVCALAIPSSTLGCISRLPSTCGNTPGRLSKIERDRRAYLRKFLSPTYARSIASRAAIHVARGSRSLGFDPHDLLLLLPPPSLSPMNDPYAHQPPGDAEVARVMAYRSSR